MASAGSNGQPDVDLRACHREVAMIGYCNHLLSRALDRIESVEWAFEHNSSAGAAGSQHALLTECKQALNAAIAELETAQVCQENRLEAEVTLLTE